MCSSWEAAGQKWGRGAFLWLYQKCWGFLTLKKQKLPTKPPLGLLVNSSLIEISEIVLLEGPEVGFACLPVLSYRVPL